VPATPSLEAEYLPSPEKIEAAIRKVLGTNAARAAG
jgi:hypothetical protein